MKKVFGLLDRFIVAMLGELTPRGMCWARASTIVLVFAAGMSFDFGIQVSWLHGAFLAGLTFVAAFGPEAAQRAFEADRPKTGLALGLGAAAMLALEFLSAQSYTAGIRGHDISGANVQNAKHGDVRSTVETRKARLEALAAKAKELDDGLAKLTQRRVGDWAVTVKPSSSAELDGAIAAKKLEVANEAKRVKCGTICEARTNELAHLESLRAAAKAIEDNQLAYTQAMGALEQAQREAAGTEYRSSAVVHSNQSIADLVAFVRSYGSRTEPSKSEDRGTQIFFNLAMAFAGTSVPAYGYYAAGQCRRRRREDEDDGAPSAMSEAQMASLHERAASPASAPATALQYRAPRVAVRARTTTISDLRARLAAA